MPRWALDACVLQLLRGRALRGWGAVGRIG